MGYRGIYKLLKPKGYISRWDDVRQIVKQLNSDSGKLRKRRRMYTRRYVADGPNFIRHLSEHDKVKPFDFNILECIDKFSQCLI